MSQMTRLATTGGVVLTLCGALFGCSARTYVSGTGSTPAQFTHVFITTQEVWFNTSANASPDDSGWSKFPLTNPVTIDLVQESNGTLGQIAGDLRVAPGTYNSILLLPVATTLATTTSATAIGATYNQEADFVDPSGTSHQVQLVLPNPEKGIVASGTSLKVPVGGGGLPTSGSSTSTTGTTGTTSTTGTATSGTSTSSSNTTVTVSFGTNFDANRDLHLFNYTVAGTATPGVLLGPNPVATDLATTGGISGTISLTTTALTSTTTPTAITSVSDRVAIQASAELLSSDQSNPHHVIVASAPVQTDGTFTIYPLQSNSKTPTVYDVVIHGPGIQTIIIKNVSVTTTTPSLADAAATTGAVATTTASGAVSIGTINPVASTSFYYENVTPNTTTPLPAGAAVTFYETLPASGEVPYAIDEVGIDPINQNLQTPEPLAVGPIESGVYATSGSTITVTSSVPAEGSGKYLVGATSPLFADAGLSSSYEAAPGTTYTAFQAAPTAGNVNVPSLSPANSAGAGSITATIATSSNQYDSGELLVSHNGAVIGSVSISKALAASGGSAEIDNIPSGVGNYYLSAILWSSTGASGFTYQSIASPVTVTAGSTTPVSVTVE